MVRAWAPSRLTRRYINPRYLYLCLWKHVKQVALLSQTGRAMLRPSAILNFWNLEFMSRGLYGHAILLPCAKFQWNRIISCWVMAKNDFKNGGCPPSWILKFFCIWSRDCHRVPNLYPSTKFHQNRMIFRWDMAISRFSRWRICAMLNFMGPIMGFLKSQYGTSYRSLIETIARNCLVFEKIAYLCAHFSDRQTDKRTDKQTNR